MAQGPLLVLVPVFWMTLTTAAREIAEAQVGDLISRLGSPRYETREDAARQILTFGNTALEPLKKADRRADPEVRRRAAKLAHRIARQLDRQRLLRSRMVLIGADNHLVQDVLLELGHQFECEFQLRPTKHWAGKRISMPWQRLSFWEALDRICEECDAHAEISGSLIESSATQRSRNNMDHSEESARTVNKIHIRAGPDPALATATFGALRARILLESMSRDNDSKIAQFQVKLEMAPGTKWYGLNEIQLAEAVDGFDQKLSHAVSAAQTLRSVTRKVAVNRAPFNGLGNNLGGAAQGGVTPVPVTNIGDEDKRGELIRLRLPDNSPPMIRHLRLRAYARVQSPAAQFLEAKNVLQAEGKTIPGPRGSSLRIIRIIHKNNADYFLYNHLVCPTEANVDDVSVEAMLLDKNGQEYEVVRNRIRKRGRDKRSFLLETEFRPAPGQTAPVTFRCATTWPVMLDVPLEFNNIPLPSKEN